LGASTAGSWFAASEPWLKPTGRQSISKTAGQPRRRPMPGSTGLGWNIKHQPIKERF